ncbi:MAG: NADH:ubiquinone reductase (Na(+)-transporting) subunit E [Flavobacteriales bacterium]|nr:NADH:ubiquinone reductase (Na(+)-transporting) subunit E [Flavobacteriales bacterium]
MEYLDIFIKASLVDNMVFAFFLGMCSFLAVSKNVKSAVGLGVAVLVVMALTVPVNYLMYKYILADGALSWAGGQYAEIDLSFLSFIMYIIVIASVVQLLEMVLERYFTGLYTTLGVFLPLIAVNCAILGASLFMQSQNFSDVYQSTVYGAGCGVGWLLAIVLLACIREKIRYSHIPKPFEGLAMTFIVTGLMAIGFMGFMGFKIG